MAVKPIVLPITYKSDPKGLRSAEKQLKGFASGIGKAVAGAGLAVAGLGAVSVKAFADFDSAMQQSVAIMGDVSDAMRKDMSNAAREVAKTTTFSATQAAESFYFLASAGLDATSSIKAMPKVAQFAQAGMFDMALATDLLTDAQSALGLTIRDDAVANMNNMVRVSDVLVKANTLANASVQQFSEALTNKAGAAMKSVGMDIEEGVAVLAAFADQGIKGVDAGTKFSIVLRDLQTRALENKSAFEQAGVSVFDASGEFRNMGDIIGELEGALVGLSDAEQKTLLLGLGFTDKSVSAIQALLGTSEAIKAYEASLSDASGTTEDIAAKQLQSFSGQMELLKSAFVDVGLEIGEGLSVQLQRLVIMIRPLVDRMGPMLVQAFKDMMPVLEELITAFPKFVDSMIPLIPTIMDLAKVFFDLIGNLLPVFIGVLNILMPILTHIADVFARNGEVIAVLAVAFMGMVGVVKTLNTIINVSKLAMIAWNAAMAMNPIGIWVAAIAAVIAGLTYFFTQTETGRQLWGQFSEFFLAVVNGIGIAFTDLVTNFGEKWQEVVDFFTNLWAGFGEFFGAVGEGIYIAFADLGEKIMGFFSAVGEFLGGVMLTFVEGFAAAWEWARDAFETGATAIGDFFKGVVNGYISIWEGFINFFIGGINNIISGLNKISFKAPDWVEGIGGKKFGINIPYVPKVTLPRLADGGIVKAQPGGIIANIGEGRYNEAVIPLKPGMGLGNTYNITVNAGMGASGSRVGEEIIRHIKQYERTSGPVFARA